MLHQPTHQPNNQPNAQGEYALLAEQADAMCQHCLNMADELVDATFLGMVAGWPQAIGSKIHEQINQQIIQSPQTIDQNLSKIDARGPLGGVWAPSWPQEPTRARTVSSRVRS